ncbi:MAG: Trk system potassium transporter TrkA [Gemmiger sp.]
MKIVIVGLGKVGRALTQQLTADRHDVVVIDRKQELVEDIVNIHDVRGVSGNGACYEVQEQAFENGADLLIAATDSDEINILACLVAKKLKTKHTIARIRNPEYEQQLRIMRGELGLSMIINPEKATAREIARILRFPSAMKLEQFSKQRFELVEYRLGAGNPLEGLQLSDLYRSIRVKVLICAVARGKQIFIPTGSFTLQAGDTIYLTATPQELEQFFRRLGLFKARATNVMVVGASRMAYYLVKELSEMSMHVTLIDSNLDRCQEMSERLPGTLVIHGDGTDAELLAEEGLAEMDAFVALTGLDETNIILSMYASRLTDCKVVAKINRQSFADIVTEKGLVDSLVSAGAVTTELIVQYVRAMQNSQATNVHTLHRLVGGKVEALEFGVTADVPFAGVPLRNLNLKNNLLVAGIIRENGETLIPSGNDSFRPGDDVIIVTTNTDLTDLRDIVAK